MSNDLLAAAPCAPAALRLLAPPPAGCPTVHQRSLLVDSPALSEGRATRVFRGPSSTVGDTIAEEVVDPLRKLSGR